jgi:hypothetical protein
LIIILQTRYVSDRLMGLEIVFSIILEGVLGNFNEKRSSDRKSFDRKVFFDDLQSNDLVTISFFV